MRLSSDPRVPARRQAEVRRAMESLGMATDLPSSMCSSALRCPRCCASRSRCAPGEPWQADAAITRYLSGSIQFTKDPSSPT